MGNAIKRVFLSGGTHSQWRQAVKDRMPNVEFYDPTSLGKLDMAAIANTERIWLDQCDCLFFYFEANNPSGLGSAFEVGYCIAKNVPVFFVDEKRTSHTEWLGVHCNKVFFDIEDALAFLERFVTDSHAKGKKST